MDWLERNGSTLAFGSASCLLYIFYGTKREHLGPGDIPSITIIGVSSSLLYRSLSLENQFKASVTAVTLLIPGLLMYI